MSDRAALSFDAGGRWLPVDLDSDPREWSDRMAAIMLEDDATADGWVRRQALADKLFMLADAVGRTKPVLAFVVFGGPWQPATIAEVLVAEAPPDASTADLAEFAIQPPDSRVGDVQRSIVHTASGPAVRVRQHLLVVVADERTAMEQVIYLWHVPSRGRIVALSAMTGAPDQAAELLPVLDELATGCHTDTDLGAVE